jgi:dihydroxyacetone kinase-like predicted kinase
VDLQTNLKHMCSAAKGVRTIELTLAVRSTVANRLNIKAGDIIGFLDDELISSGQDYQTVVFDILSQINLTDYEIATIYYGQDSSWQQADALVGKVKEHYPDLDLEIHNGGQPHYYYIISLE